MIKNYEKEKELMKEKMNKEIDAYFEKFFKVSEQADFDINKIEKLMKENRQNTTKILNETTSTLTGNIDLGF